MGKPKTGDSKMMKKADIHLCMCGGEVKMISVFSKGRVQHRARCVKCKEERRCPSEFK